MVGVIFDLFETLVTEGPVWGARARGAERSWQVGAAENLGVSAEVFRQVWEGFKDARMRSVIPFEDVLRRVCDDAGVLADEKTIGRLDRERRAAKAACFDESDRGVLEMLDTFASTGVPMAILSNCTGEELDGLEGSAIGRLIEHRVLSFEIGHQKPEAEAYHPACVRLQLRPSECFFVGDGAFDELNGARRAGLRPVWARWFMRSWPPDVAERHESLIAPQGFPAAWSPSDVTAMILSGA